MQNRITTVGQLKDILESSEIDAKKHVIFGKIMALLAQEDKKLVIGYLEIMQRPFSKHIMLEPYCFYTKKAFDEVFSKRSSALDGDNSNKDNDDNLDVYLYVLYVQLQTAICGKLSTDNTNQKKSYNWGELKKILGGHNQEENTKSNIELYINVILDRLKKFKDETPIPQLAIFEESYNLNDCQYFGDIIWDENNFNDFLSDTQNTKNVEKMLLALYMELCTWRNAPYCANIIYEGVSKAEKSGGIAAMVIGFLILGLDGFLQLSGWILDSPYNIPHWLHVILWVLDGIILITSIICTAFRPIAHCIKNKIIKRNSEKYLLDYRWSLIKGSQIKVPLKNLLGNLSLSLYSRKGQDDIYIVEIRLTYKGQSENISVKDAPLYLYGKLSYLRLYETKINDIFDEDQKEWGEERIKTSYLKKRILEVIKDIYAKNGVFYTVDSDNAYSYLFEPYNPSKFEEGQYGDKSFIPLVERTINNVTVPLNHKEDADSVPTDFFFKYAIVDEEGNNAKNHFLIYPERNNDKNGNYVWDLKLVVLDWNYKKIYPSGIFPFDNYEYIQFENEIVDKDLYFGGALTKNTRPWYCDNVNNEGSAGEHRNRMSFNLYHDVFSDKMIKGDEPNKLTGDFTLCKELSDTNKSRKFHFSIIFFPKKILRYKKERKSNSSCEVMLKRVGIKSDGGAVLRREIFGRIKCPCCGRILTYNKKKQGEKYCYSSNKDLHICQYNPIACAYKKNDDNILLYNTDYNFPFDNKNPLRVTDEKYCLRVDNDIQHSCITSFIGITATGKTTFIGRLFGDKFDCEFLSNALKPYAKKVEQLKFTTELYQDVSSISQSILKGNGGALIPDKTSSDKMDPIKATVYGNVPFAIKISGLQNYSENACMSFFDLPGGCFEGGNPAIVDDNKLFVENTVFYRSDCFILLIDGSTRHDENGDGRGFAENIEETCEGIKKILNKYKEKNRKKPIVAVVLAKFDKLIGEFKKESYIRTSPPVAKAMRFKNSEIHKYIDACSYELESYINEKFDSQQTFLDILKSNTAAYKFFAVSAFGRADSTLTTEDREVKELVYLTNSTNMQNVLLWLMYQTNIIK